MNQQVTNRVETAKQKSREAVEALQNVAYVDGLTPAQRVAVMEAVKTLDWVGRALDLD